MDTSKVLDRKEDEAGDIAASLVWDQIPGELLDECVHYGSKAIEVWKGVSI